VEIIEQLNRWQEQYVVWKSNSLPAQPKISATIVHRECSLALHPGATVFADAEPRGKSLRRGRTLTALTRSIPTRLMAISLFAKLPTEIDLSDLRFPHAAMMRHSCSRTRTFRCLSRVCRVESSRHRSGRSQWQLAKSEIAIRRVWYRTGQCRQVRPRRRDYREVQHRQRPSRRGEGRASILDERIVADIFG